MSGTITFDGLATGIKSSETIDKIMQVEGRPKLLKQAEQTRLQNQSTAWQNINTKLLDLSDKAKTLWSASGWSTAVATSSDATVLTATATTTAQPGTYAFQVTKLAQNHQIASAGAASASSTVGTGTLTVGIGSNTTAITIDSTNNTLTGVAQAINNADLGITASVINDGTDGSGYRLLLSSDETGADNTISTTVGAGLSLTFPSVVQDAQDAEVKFGSGAGALTVTSATNSVSGLVGGITLNLVSEKPGSTVTLTVSRDTTNTEKTIQAFVDSYNGAMALVSAQFLYDDSSKTGGILMGDQALVAIQDRIQGLLISPVATGGDYRSLQGIGLKLADDGTLGFDTATFASAASKDYTSVEKLFRTTGNLDNSKISFIYAGKNAYETPRAGYTVHITAAAEQAKVVASQVATTTITGANNSLQVKLDGGSTLTVTLSEGTYTADTLAAEVEAKINAASGSSNQVAVTNGSGYLSISSVRYGSASQVTLTGGTAVDALGFSAGQGAIGVDVAGTINGEEATGSGKTLTGNSGNARTDGVQLLVDATASDVGGGLTAMLSFTKGVATRFYEYLQNLTDPVDGTIETRSSGLAENIRSLQDEMDQMQTRLDTKRASLVDMFRRMEDAVSKLNTQGSYLTNQLAALFKS